MEKQNLNIYKINCELNGRIRKMTKTLLYSKNIVKILVLHTEIYIMFNIFVYIVSSPAILSLNIGFY